MSEKIYHHKTKEYFGEIISSYNNNNYRSASVMLWSVAVIDLVFKLQDLVDLHSDKDAESILKTMRAKNRKSSKWERELISEIDKRTKLLSSDNICFLEYLYQQRNLSAHPVLDSNLELHKPSRITVRALIENTVNGVLTKPPFFSKDIVASIVIDLEASKSYLEDDRNKLKNYLESRFFSKMTLKVELEVFKALWKFVFKLEDDKTKENRKINFQALSYLYEKNKPEALPLIDNEAEYFSDISKKEKTISYLIQFLSLNTSVYKKLKKSARVLIDDRVDKFESDFYKSNFKYKNLEMFHKSLLDYLEKEDDANICKSDINFLYKLSDSPEWESKVRILRNAYYGKSGSFEEAESRFEGFISPVLSEYTNEEMIDLLSRVNSNGQIHGRSFNKYINTKVKEYSDKILGDDFDYSPYKNFIDAVS